MLFRSGRPQAGLHTSSRIPASRGCTTLVLPVCVYPERKKSLIVYDLMADPEPLLQATAEEISERVFTAAQDLPAGVDRIPLKALHTNHVPMVAPAATLKAVDCKRIGLDPQRCFAHAQKLTAALRPIRNKVMDAFKPRPPGADHDPDHMLYTGGFFSPGDRRLMDEVRLTNPAGLTKNAWAFQDPRLPEMLFRYRARNFPDSLSPTEQQRWQTQRLQRLMQPTDARQLNPETFAMEISAAKKANKDNCRALNILDQLEAWSSEICRAQ